MPHGVGHHGGGGGGGVHHHHHGGGGFARHHHHHHHLGNRYNRPYYYGGGPYWYGYRRRPITWVFTSLIVSVVVIIACVVTVRYVAAPDYTYDDGLDYAPIDTRIIPFSNTFCKGLTLGVSSISTGYTVSLYMLDSPPKLARLEAFSFSDHLDYDVDEDYHYFYYYMYPGSNFSVRACISNEDDGTGSFYLIEGNSNFNAWRNNYYSVPDKKTYPIDEMCSPDTNATTYFYETEKEDYYYLIFYKESLSFSLDVNLAFNRTLYEPSSNASDSCSVDISSFNECSVEIPMSGQTAYLTVEPQPGTIIDWSEDGVGLWTSCVARVWVFALISIGIVLGLVAIVVPILVCGIVWLRKSKKSAATMNAAGAATDKAPNAPLISDYQQPPAYGTAPPQYKA